jgi:hypothetical protein
MEVPGVGTTGGESMRSPLIPELSGEKLGVVACAHQPSGGEKHKIGGLWSKPVQAKSKTLSPK